MLQVNARQSSTDPTPAAKLLVIEDEPLLRQEVVEWLTFEGYAAIGAADGLSGVEEALRWLPDLIICDITMPRLDGYGVLMAVHANPTMAAIPFIFITARASHEDVRKGMNLGADDYLTKPFKRLELLETVRARLQKKVRQEQERLQQVAQLQHSFSQQHERRLLKSKLATMFSHDLRSPLSSILLTTSLLRDYGSQLSNERRLTHLNHIEASGRLLLQMLDDIIVIAQLENESLIFTPEPLELTPVLQQIMDESRLIYGVRRPLHFTSTATGLALVDLRLLRQIVTNLLSNAIKYSARDSTVQISLAQSTTQCQLTIQDQGIGIPEAELAMIAELFQAGSNAMPSAGAGLGRTIVKQAVDLHGGSLQIDSQPNVGTTVTVTLPV